MSKQDHILQKLKQLGEIAKRRYVSFVIWRQLPFVITLMGVLTLLNLSVQLILFSALILITLCVYQLVSSQQWRRLNTIGMLKHLNAEFPQLEQSAELLITKDPENNLLFTLQKRKVIEQLAGLLSSSAEVLPSYDVRRSQINSILLILVFGVLTYVNPFQAINGLLANAPLVSDKHSVAATDTQFKVSVGVFPPAYSGQQSFQQGELDISVLEGSEIVWTVETPGLAPTISMAVGQNIAFEQHGKHVYVASIIANQSSIYTLDVPYSPNPSVNSISVISDTPPKIRVVEPQNTITEFKKTSVPIFTTKVIVRDDFDISKVDILASVAKGSGEAVKFRDEIFEFDRQTRTEHTLELDKSWSAEQLGLEPGDELYFTVRAWDNKQPTAQMSRSETKIFRWLDDDAQAIISDGILIDIMPEYFKSQRQIIIETQQLIADKDILSEQVFDQTSRSLGHSQSDLKLKYGQYLGDEFDDGSGGHQMEKGPGVPDIHINDGDHNDSDDNDDHAGHNHQNQFGLSALLGHANEDNKSTEEQVVGFDTHNHSDTGHDHGASTPSLNSTGQDKSGYQQTIEQYGHNHGDTDIGIMGTQSPKALMKQAIANMWDAELHLMLSAPEKALPFEKKALVFLNQARKAERVYVKRLGFEPPPVTEKRRYQGDLSDILSYQQNQVVTDDDGIYLDIQQLLRHILIIPQAIVIEANTQTTRQPEFAIKQAGLDAIERVQKHLTVLAQNRPALMRHVATLQQIQQQKTWELNDCDGCIQSLYQALWRQLPEPVAVPSKQHVPYSKGDKTIQYYQEYLRATKQTSETTP